LRSRLVQFGVVYDQRCGGEQEASCIDGRNKESLDGTRTDGGSLRVGRLAVDALGT
jgi:hypothetical protein